MTQWIHRPWSRVVVFGAVAALGAGVAVSACSSSGDDVVSNPDTGVDTGTPDTTVADSGADTTDANKDSALPDTTPPDTGCTPFDGAGIDAVNAEAGFNLIAEKGCRGCHTADLSGATSPLGTSVYPKNLTPDPKTGIGCLTNDQLVKAITTGVGPDGEIFCTMPKFSDSTLRDGGVDGGIQSIIDYLRTLPAVNKVVPATVCPSDAGTDAADAPADGG